MKSKNNILFVLTVLLGIMSAYFVFGAPNNIPTGPDSLSVLNGGRYPDKNDSEMIQAEAGNVTELSIFDTRSTEAWQGYFGNVTGTITLDDAQNYTFYSWSLASPTGEIYATNVSYGINWPTVACVNFSADISAAQTMNLQSLEDVYGINATDRDGFDETFNQTYQCGGANPACFKVGSRITPTNTCHMVTTYVDEAHQQTSFKEVLMGDNVSGAVLFVALIEDNVDGFKTGVDAHDFQMLVAENGHPLFEQTTTPYYFYVELA